MPSTEKNRQMFEFFNEIGIVYQLSTTIFNRSLPDNLHIAHFSVLNHLVRLGDGKTPLQLSDSFQVSKGTMSNTLNDLSSRGWIKSKPHETDKRSKLIFLTASGKSFQKQAIDELLGAFKEIEEKIDAQKLLLCLPQLRELRKVLDENRSL